MDYTKQYDLDKTCLYYKVEPMIESAKALTSPMSMPKYLGIIIRHSIKRELYLGDDVDGEFLLADQSETLTKNSIVVDWSLFNFRDDFINQSVRKALSATGVNKNVWGSISDEVMAEGIRMGRTNFETYNYRSWNSDGTVRVYDTLTVHVVTFERFVCYEGFGES